MTKALFVIISILLEILLRYLKWRGLPTADEIKEYLEHKRRLRAAWKEAAKYDRKE